MPVAEDTPSERRNSRKPWTLTTNGHTRAGRALYAFLWVLCRTLSLVFFGFRSKFAEPLPSEGGLLVLASHQSHLDPLLLGLASPRRLSSLARSSLFTNRFLGEVISLLDAVPIDRESSSIGAMKAIISRLKAGKAVIIFPEGTRTGNGQLGEIKGGFTLIARRAGVPIVPVAIVGAYECWPRSRLLPQTGRIRLEFGRLITPEEIAATDDETLLRTYRDALVDLDAHARSTLAHARPSLIGWQPR